MDIPFLKKYPKLPILQILLAGTLVIFLLLTIPQCGNLSKVSKEVAEKRQTLADIEYGINNFHIFENELNSLQAQHDSFFSRLPPEREFPLFLELLSKLAKDSDVKIIAIEPQKVKDYLQNTLYVEIPVFINAYCGYHDLGRFINDIEFADKLMRVETVKIVAEGESARHQVVITVITFCLKDKEGEGTVI
ncbi:MAG: type 4a pilus biogenesis protein PilO [Candidatus Omnitrophica bacterium]|nr:type 4a pilus biogenesis protein PilO [Candidatus Omnitrophota bacterium]